MSSLATGWSTRFDDDQGTWCKGTSKQNDYNPQAYCNEKGELVLDFSLFPYQQLQLDYSRERDPLKKRINRWLRQIARAEGYDVPFEEDDIQQVHFTGPVWQEWGSTNDWLRVIEESGHLDPDPLADQVSDPKLIADFNFVEKTAKKRKMTERDARRLHIVYRLSTEDKIKRINEMVNSLSSLITLDKRGSGSSATSRASSNRRF